MFGVELIISSPVRNADLSVGCLHDTLQRFVVAARDEGLVLGGDFYEHLHWHLVLEGINFINN